MAVSDSIRKHLCFTPRGLAILGVGLGLVAGACGPEVTRFLNDNHCANTGGDAWCQSRYPDGSRLFCTWGTCGPTPGRDGCVDERPPSDDCYSPCGGGNTIAADESCIAGGTASGSGTETSTGTGTEPTEGSSSTGPIPCMGPEDCPDAAAPFCASSGECVDCAALDDPDGECAQIDPGMPLCIGETCVACSAKNTTVCDEQLLLCDDASHECTFCTEHEQCAAGACDLFDGRCFDPANVLHVGSGPPYEDIASALAAVDSMELGRAVIVLHEGTGFNETAEVTTGAIAFINAADELPLWINGGALAPTLAATGMDTRVYLLGLRLAVNANDVGLSCDGARVDVQRSRIVQNAGGGIVATNGCELVIVNSFVGGGANDTVSLDIDSASASVLYSTVATSTFGNTPAIGCTAPIAVNIRNSIVASQGGTPPDELSCVEAVVTTSATESETPPFDTGWFTDFNGGDYSLTMSGATTFMSIAQWQDGDPPTDIDGDLRPTDNDRLDYVGADVPQ
ncbi:MAG: hypothetical protein K0V04_10040 [Deltaproteobacteria bacterium]|nr:hypothetical protein [Deltaproteobacteria bacterium]